MRFCGNCGSPTAGLGPELSPRKTAREPERQAISGPERRQLTIVFCDLVGSTKLSGLLDPEDLNRVQMAYRDAAVQAIEGHGGIVPKFIGDGLLGLFGYPVAHEDDPRRAVRAAIATLVAMVGVNSQLEEYNLPAIDVRIGIHTGLVLVGGIGTAIHFETQAVVGQAPNIASRLQSLAEPNEIVISDTTHALVEGWFACVDKGPHTLAGVAIPMRVFGVRNELTSDERLTTRRSATPMIGRERELSDLITIWKHVKASRGHCVVIEGEPGIGKSRLVAEFIRQGGITSSAIISIVCSAEGGASAFHPMIQWFWRRRSLSSEADPAERTRLLTLKERGIKADDHDNILFDLLDTIGRGPTAEPAAVPARRRRQLIEALIRVVLVQAQREPVLMIVEDCHWADDSTLTLLRTLAEQIGDVPIMIVLTARSRVAAWASDVQRITLERITIEEARLLARHVVRGALPDSLLDRIVARTDGVPLFVEEVAWTALGTDRSLHSANLAGRGDIPMTLRDSLMAQLDRLGASKRIAQLAAVLGRSFRSEIFRAVHARQSGPDSGELDGAFRQLVDAGLFERESEGDAYQFRHVLIQETAYDTLLREQRQRYHLQVASILREQFADSADGRPEILAQHLAAADCIGDAVEQYSEAARRAAQLSANVEALHHYQSALELALRAPETRARNESELGLQIALAAQLIVANGNAAPGVETAIQRAQELCEALGNERLLFRTRRSLQTFHMVRGDIQEAHRISLQLLEQAATLNDGNLQIQALRPYGLCLLYLGRFSDARGTLRQVLDMYVPAQHAIHRFEYGSDPGVLAHAHLGWVEWFLGNVDAAMAESVKAIEGARMLNHPHSLCFAIAFHGCLQQFQDNSSSAGAAARQLAHVARTHEYAYWCAWSEILEGWALARAGDRASGEQLLQKGLLNYSKTGARLLRPYALSLLAEILPDERSDEAVGLLRTAIKEGSDGSILFWQRETLAQLHKMCLINRRSHAKSTRV
jgi:class 3 adenylate cyclase